ncbi:hypothetical protein B7494_g8295 [Chlorociboria aeruginascens]|nr:hypothetical protein B7494_g8295 [Chlorociboria aeruginascens]
MSMQTGISGLTANSATQTSKDGHNTILPIWFLSRGIGIIELPPAGIEVGGIIRSRTNPTVNVDHVYELSILKQYFSSRITAANCAAFKAIFDVPDQGNPQVTGDTRLQTIWRQLPSNTNPDFAGMDAKINAVKAQAFSNAFSNPAGSDDSLGYLYQLALGIKITNDPRVSPLFKNTNNRIYAALLGMDALINAANNCGSGPAIIQGDWASSYETWITNLLTTAGNQVNKQVSIILNDNTRLGSAARTGSTTGQDGKTTATTNSIGSGVAAFLNAYPTPNAFTFSVSSLIDFPLTSTLLIKRQGEACSISISSTSQPVSTLDSTTTTKLVTTTFQPTSTSLTSQPPLTTSAPTSSSAPALPSSCPDGCQCFQAAQGGCDCLCS